MINRLFLTFFLFLLSYVSSSFAKEYVFPIYEEEYNFPIMVFGPDYYWKKNSTHVLVPDDKMYYENKPTLAFRADILHALYQRQVHDFQGKIYIITWKEDLKSDTKIAQERGKILESILKDAISAFKLEIGTKRLVLKWKKDKDLSANIGKHYIVITKKPMSKKEMLKHFSEIILSLESNFQDIPQ